MQKVYVSLHYFLDYHNDFQKITNIFLGLLHIYNQLQHLILLPKSFQKGQNRSVTQDNFSPDYRDAFLLKSFSLNK